ncbi:hypothetical protein [Pandoraea communis]|nr:hypothetical protein [Pandoraea communis]
MPVTATAIPAEIRKMPDCFLRIDVPSERLAIALHEASTIAAALKGDILG